MLEYTKAWERVLGISQILFSSTEVYVAGLIYLANYLCLLSGPLFTGKKLLIFGFSGLGIFLVVMHTTAMIMHPGIYEKSDIEVAIAMGARIGFFFNLFILILLIADESTCFAQTILPFPSCNE